MPSDICKKSELASFSFSQNKIEKTAFLRVLEVSPPSSVGAQKSIETFLRSPRIARYSGVVFFSQNVFFKIKGCFSVTGVVFPKIIFGYFKSLKIARNSGVVYFSQKVFFKIKSFLSVIGVVFSKLIFGYFKSPKMARNSSIVSFFKIKVFMYWRC